MATLRPLSDAELVNAVLLRVVRLEGNETSSQVSVDVEYACQEVLGVDVRERQSDVSVAVYGSPQNPNCRQRADISSHVFTLSGPLGSRQLHERRTGD